MWKICIRLGWLHKLCSNIPAEYRQILVQDNSRYNLVHTWSLNQYGIGRVQRAKETDSDGTTRQLPKQSAFERSTNVCPAFHGLRIINGVVVPEAGSTIVYAHIVVKFTWIPLSWVTLPPEIARLPYIYTSVSTALP